MGEDKKAAYGRKYDSVALDLIFEQTIKVLSRISPLPSSLLGKYLWGGKSFLDLGVVNFAVSIILTFKLEIDSVVHWN